MIAGVHRANQVPVTLSPLHGPSVFPFCLLDDVQGCMKIPAHCHLPSPFTGPSHGDSCDIRRDIKLGNVVSFFTWLSRQKYTAFRLQLHSISSPLTHQLPDLLFLLNMSGLCGESGVQGIDFREQQAKILPDS